MYELLLHVYTDRILCSYLLQDFFRFFENVTGVDHLDINWLEFLRVSDSVLVEVLILCKSWTKDYISIFVCLVRMGKKSWIMDK